MQKLMLGPFPRGLRKDLTAFAIDNDSFPTLLNAYQWRGRIKRKRGTSLLGRLSRYFDSLLISYNTGTTTITLDGTGAENILANESWTLETNSSIVPGSVEIIGNLTYTDPAMDGTLSPEGDINYSTGAILIPDEANVAVSANFRYYPVLPVMGFEDLNYNVVYAQMGRGKTERIVAGALANVAATLAKLSMDACLFLNQNILKY